MCFLYTVCPERVTRSCKVLRADSQYHWLCCSIYKHPHVYFCVPTGRKQKYGKWHRFLGVIRHVYHLDVINNNAGTLRYMYVEELIYTLCIAYSYFTILTMYVYVSCCYYHYHHRVLALCHHYYYYHSHHRHYHYQKHNHYHHYYDYHYQQYH